MNGKPIPFRQDVPIVGQTFTLKSGYSTVLITCNCEAKEPVVLIGNMPNACKACGRAFVCAQFTCNQQGQIQAHIGLVQQQPAAPEPAGVPS